MVDPRLDEIMLRWEEMRQSGQSPDPEQLCRDCPELLDEARSQILALERMEAMFATQEEHNGPVTNGSSMTTPVDGLSTASKYQVLGFHARGGLGEVLLARDEILHRPVALKRILHAHDRDPKRRARFLREASITSRLEHPGIVPVYGMGEDSTGRPCYTMRFIQGETLQQAIANFHDASLLGTDREEQRFALHRLLNRFISACNAIAYAHSQNIIHRDIKPANIMLGKYGETLVVDWGLAKVISQADTERDMQPEQGVEDDAQSDCTPDHVAGETQRGQAVGTPAYMSPEQATGQWDQVGPASDIYSLGATLYVLLTNQAPVQASSAPVLLERIQRGQFPPPRHWKKDVSPALEAVCLKAMALRPHDRYATAVDLAADIEHWLADEPVSAWPDPWSVRARRWISRNRTLATSTIVAALVGVVVLSVSTVLLVEAYRKERQSAAEAEENFQNSRQVVDDYLLTVSQNKLSRLPGAQPLRRELLQKALRYYQTFVTKRPNEPLNRANVASAYIKIGQIVAEVGTVSDAVDSYEKGVALWRELVATFPDEPTYRHDLADALDRFALDLHRQASRLEEANKAVSEAVALSTARLRENPKDPAAENLLARTLLNQASLLGLQGRQEDALTVSRRAVAMNERLRHQSADNRALRFRMVSLLNNQGCDLRELGRNSEALQAFDESRRICEELVAEEQADPRLRDYANASTDSLGLLANKYANLGTLHVQMDDYPQAAQYQAKAVATYRAAIAAQPDVFLHRQFLVNVLARLAQSRVILGQLDQALKDSIEARTLCEQLLKEDPGRILIHAHLGMAWDAWGAVQGYRGQRDLAREAFARGLAECRKTITHSPDLIDGKFILSFHYVFVAAVQQSWHEPAEAEKTLQAMCADLEDYYLFLYMAARQLACNVPLVATPADRQRTVEQAMGILHRAVAKGFRDAESLVKEEAWAPLRSRPDFQQLLGDLEKANPRVN